MLSKLYMEGKLKISTDNGKDSPNGPFVGLEKIADAVEVNTLKHYTLKCLCLGKFLKFSYHCDFIFKIVS